jgi:hypothetical protein
MTASREAVLDLLRKWSTEASPILCSIECPWGVVFVGGNLTFNPSGFVISHEPYNALAVSLDQLKQASYEDLREGDPRRRQKLEGKVAGILTLIFPEAKFQLHESIL